MPNIAIVHTETTDETKPAGTRARSLGDDDIREFKRAIRERLAIDHEFAADETGNDAIGIHKQVTMKALADDPTPYDDVGYVYLKTVSGVIELFYEDSDGNVIQISTGGKILGDSVQLTNNAYLKAKNAAGDGEVDLIKANASDAPVLPDGAEMASGVAPTTDVQIPNKKYVDDQVAAGVVTFASLIGPKVYDSGWFSAAVNTGYTKNHNLGTTKLLCQLYYASDNAGTGMFDMSLNDGNEGNQSLVTSQIVNITTTQLTVNTGNNAIASAYAAPGAHTEYATGYLRVVALALE